MGLLHLEVLGPIRITHAGKPVLFPTRKAEALLIYLALHRGVQSRKQLAMRFWPGHDTSRVLGSLRSTLVRLRQALGEHEEGLDHLKVTPDTLTLLQDESLCLDIQLVERAWQRMARFSSSQALAHDEQQVIEEALALVRGPFAENLPLQELPELEEWTHSQRLYWQHRAVDLADRLSQSYMLQGRWQEAGQKLLHWLELDPLSHDATQRLMQVVAAQGRQSEALNLYQHYCSRLRAELDAEPDADLQTLALQIRQATSTLHPAARPTQRLTAAALLEQAPMVGRASELELLIEHTISLRQGLSHTIAITGEAGIGKSRLLREFVPWAQSQGTDVLQCQTSPNAGRLPYQPMIGLLRSRLESINALEDALEDVWLTELSRLLPEVRDSYPDLPPPAYDPTVGPTHLYEAIARLLMWLARQRPLVVVLEDLHWADQATLDLLLYLVGSWRRQPNGLLLVLTYRLNEGPLTSRLDTWLYDLERGLPVVPLALNRLSEHEMYDYVVWLHTHSNHAANDPVTAPSEPQPLSLEQVTGRLYQRTQGQPLYLVEMLKDLLGRVQMHQDGGKGGVNQLDILALLTTTSWESQLPPRVRQLILDRLRRLTPEARRLLSSVAVLEQEVSLAILLPVSGLSESQGLVALEEASGLGFLQGCTEGRYRFVHELMREVVYRAEEKGQLQLLHQRAVIWLSARPTSMATLAYHAERAGWLAEALCCYVEAGDEALEVFAIRDAITSYEHARAILARVLDTRDAHQQVRGARVQRLLIQCGQAYELLEQWEAARQVYETVNAYAEQQRDDGLRAMTLTHLARVMARNPDQLSHAQALLHEARLAAERCGYETPFSYVSESAWEAVGASSLFHKKTMPAP